MSFHNKKRKNKFNNEKGMAIVETLPLLIIFLVLITYGLGMWGAVHRGVLSSISARNYAFDTFRNRTNLYYHRDASSTNNTSILKQYFNIGFRFHGIQSPNANSLDFTATSVPIAFGQNEDTAESLAAERRPASAQQHNNGIHDLRGRNRSISVNPIWIMIGYGMCVHAACEGGN